MWASSIQIIIIGIYARLWVWGVTFVMVSTACKTSDFFTHLIAIPVDKHRHTVHLPIFIIVLVGISCWSSRGCLLVPLSLLDLIQQFILCRCNSGWDVIGPFLVVASPGLRLLLFDRLKDKKYQGKEIVLCRLKLLH
jgi:hypothetical protein